MEYTDSPKVKTISAVVIWGSAWALAELSLGHALHLIGIPGMAGFVMFPVGAALMIKVFFQTGSRKAVMGTAVVAAALKLLDLFLPSPNVFTVINPASAILCEGIAVSVIYIPMAAGKPVLRRLGAIGLAALSWRVMYTGLALSQGLLASIPSIVDLGKAHVLSFTFLESLGNLVLFLPVFHVLRRTNFYSFRLPVLQASGLFFAAAAAQMIF
jgi:hypothetical protein